GAVVPDGWAGDQVPLECFRLVKKNIETEYAADGHACIDGVGRRPVVLMDEWHQLFFDESEKYGRPAGMGTAECGIAIGGHVAETQDSGEAIGAVADAHDDDGWELFFLHHAPGGPDSVREIVVGIGDIQYGIAGMSSVVAGWQGNGDHVVVAGDGGMQMPGLCAVLLLGRCLCEG